MNCYCCGKPLKTDHGSHWHKTCIKSFFGTSVLPELEISDSTLELLALKCTDKGLTVPGVQKKLSLHLLSDGTNSKLTLVNYPTGYILKPQVDAFTALPEAEQLVMSMADITGISTVPHALICPDRYAYITKRVDRIFDSSGIRQLAMEDFCQLNYRLTQDKYRSSCERCAKVIEKYSSRKMLDMSELFLRLVFCYIVGNSDMHLKNFSLIETEEGTNEYVLSPAYDLLPVNIIMPEDKEELALPMNGKKQNLRKKDFFVFADECGIESSAATKMIKKIVSLKEKYIQMCDESLLPEHLKVSLSELILHRCSTFE